LIPPTKSLDIVFQFPTFLLGILLAIFNVYLYYMDFTNTLDQMYSNLLAEHTRLLSEMKNGDPEKFQSTSYLETQVSHLMKGVLKLKNTIQKNKMKE